MHALTNALKIINAYFVDISTEFFMVSEHPDYWKYSICHLPVTWNGNLFFHKNKVCSVPLL